MEVKRVICKACGVKLEIKNTNNDPLKIIRCPKCKATLQVVFGQPAASASPAAPVVHLAPDVHIASDETMLPQMKPAAATPAVGGETILPQRSMTSDPLPFLMCDDVEYPLEVGQNIIGRYSDNNTTATVAVDSDDRTMSRAHALINVIRLANGSYKSVVKYYQNKNIILVDGVELMQDEQLVLKDGAVLEMGLTSMIFVQKKAE